MDSTEARHVEIAQMVETAQWLVPQFDYAYRSDGARCPPGCRWPRWRRSARSQRRGSRVPAPAAPPPVAWLGPARRPQAVDARALRLIALRSSPVRVMI
jgi:hypothetical protein